MTLFTLILFIFCLSFIYSIESENEKCIYSPKPNSPEIYYINLDKSVERKANMENHLNEVGLRYFRVPGFHFSKLFIPPDIEKTWTTRFCTTNSSFVPINKDVATLNANNELHGYSAIVSGLCGRGKGNNTPKELGCSVSHLYAIRNAVYSTTSTSKYAIIVEDDVTFPFNIDYDLLASTAPQDFVILQLFNSNKESMKESYDKYLRNNDQNLWFISRNLRYWSTCAYMINRELMKPIIDEVVHEVNGWLDFKVIAGLQSPCCPQECCQDGWKFIHKPPCVLASYGYQADSFLYALAKTYTISVPIITNGRGVGLSTFHQEHVEMFHKAAFRRQRQIINEMLKGEKPLPVFITPACKILNETHI